MPKRGGKHHNYNNDDYGGSGSRFSALKDYQHDYDDRQHNRKDHKMTRRVSFKPSQLQTKGGIKGRVAEMAIRSHLEDDEDMDNFATTSKSEDRSRRKGSPIPRGKFGKNHRVVQPNAYGWYQVTIHNVQQYSKDEIVRALLSALSPDTIMPYHWRTESNCVIFFINDFKIAERLQQVARSIQFPNGMRIFPHVRNGIPIVAIDETLKMRITHAMVKRYNQQTRSLDLSKFYADPDLHDTFVGLFRQPMMNAVLEILEQNLKDLEGLNLNENNFSSLEAFRQLENRLPNLKILYLGKNRIPSLASLLVLRNVPLLEIVLKDNPLCSRYREHSLYVSEVRRKFPKLLRLDGEQLEKQILFDEFDAACSLPKAKASFLCDASRADTIRQFLEQYFQIFDSNTRQPLLDAYHEHAQLSMSIPPATQAGRLESFWRFNRNFRRVIANEDCYRQRQLKVGRLQVVTTLQEWPRTQHDIHSFSVDLTLSTPQMIIFSVDGLFKELECEKSRNDIRYFHRQFIIVPAGGGFCIRNDTVTITNATVAQQRAFMKPPADTEALATATSAMASTSLQSRLHPMQPTPVTTVQIPQNMLLPGMASQPNIMPAQPQLLNDATKLQMVQSLSAQSNMNMDWSKKCLEDTNWDYNHAIHSFNELHKENKIPPEAFIK